MNVLFIGQLGLRAGRGQGKTTRERRIEMLGRTLIERGHQVTVLGTGSYIDANITNYYGLRFVPKLSLDPQRPGGWLYVFASIATAWRQQPDVVHLHSWRAGALAWLLALVAPEATIVWTIDVLPSKYFFVARFIARQAEKVCNVITVPTRTLQYVLLNQYALPTYYIPDGYAAPRLKDLPLKTFGLRKNQYWVLLSQDPRAMRRALRAYHATRLRKKLVVVSPGDQSLQLGITTKATVMFVGEKSGRQLTTLIRQAAGIIVSAEYPGLETILQAMASGRRIVAANTPLFQETIGVTGTYYREGKSTELAQAITQAVTKSALGPAAKRRAKHHFQWDRVTPEYVALYRYRELSVIPIDSARGFAHASVVQSSR